VLGLATSPHTVILVDPSLPESDELWYYPRKLYLTSAVNYGDGIFSEQESDDIQQLKCQLLEKEKQIKQRKQSQQQK
ncbi:9705_t:CDS:2, partial [Entrophospora sp. SA101]